MSTSVPRLRMFAGLNGSGKSTINSLIRPELLGVYINPDDIFVAEITDGHALELKTEKIPNWFKHAVLDKIGVAP